MKTKVPIKTWKTTCCVSILLTLILELLVENEIVKLNLKYKASGQAGKAAWRAVDKDFLIVQANTEHQANIVTIFSGTDSAPGPVAQALKGVSQSDENGKWTHLFHSALKWREAVCLLQEHTHMHTKLWVIQYSILYQKERNAVTKMLWVNNKSFSMGGKKRALSTAAFPLHDFKERNQRNFFNRRVLSDDSHN